MTAQDPRFLGGAEGIVLTSAADMAFVVAVGWDGACDMQANVDKPTMARTLRMIADQIDPPTSPSPAGGAS